ncbi:hypothetical protein FAIPA1_630016 [Frankia sp. AiPs1]
MSELRLVFVGSFCGPGGSIPGRVFFCLIPFGLDLFVSLLFGYAFSFRSSAFCFRSPGYHIHAPELHLHNYVIAQRITN